MLDVVALSRERGLDLETIGERYYALGGDIDFAWLEGRSCPDPTRSPDPTGARSYRRRRANRAAAASAGGRRWVDRATRRPALLIDEARARHPPLPA
jgi:hypothetical protein